MIEKFIEKRFDGLWFQYLQKSNNVFLIVEGKDDITYYMSLLQAYKIKEENYTIKSPTQIYTGYENGVTGVLKIVEDYLLPYKNKIEENSNKLLIITDKDIGQHSDPDFLSEEIKKIYYQTQGYSYENDFVMDEVLKFLCNDFLNTYNRRYHHLISQGELASEKNKLKTLYDRLQSELKFVINELNKIRIESKEFKINKITRYDCVDKKIEFDTQSHIPYIEKVTKENFHGKSMITILLAILREELREINIYKPVKDTDALIQHLHGFIPSYWKEIFDENEIYQYR